MSRMDVETQLADFATALIEDAGGLVDWQSDHSSATAIVPIELAESLGQHAESFLLGAHSGESGLTLSLGGEFVDLAARTLRHFVPTAGTFAIHDLPVKKTEFDAIVESSFGWQNARARVLQGSAMSVPYHAWWFHVMLQSEETWEALIPVTLNAKTGVPIPLTGLLDFDSLRAAPEESPSMDATLETAVRLAETESMRQAAPFLNRIDARRERDQKRLQDYYRALQREASTTNRRTKTIPSKDEIEASTEVVKLELHRKLAELDERFQCSAVIRPVALAEVYIPVVGVDVEIQRKAQKRVFRLYWNAILKQMEPMSCSQCGSNARNFWFTNDTVDPICGNCHDSQR